MHQRKQHGAQGSHPGPAVVDQQAVQLGQIPQFQQGTSGEVGHDDDGDYNLIGWEAQQKGDENHPIQPD